MVQLGEIDEEKTHLIIRNKICVKILVLVNGNVEKMKNRKIINNISDSPNKIQKYALYKYSNLNCYP